jgi:hypothetical protein
VHPNPRKPTLSTWLVAAALVTCQLTVLRAAEGQVRLADIEAGVHFGFNFSNGEIEDERLGLGAIVPVLSS